MPKRRPTTVEYQSAIAYLKGYRRALVETTSNPRLHPAEDTDYEGRLGCLQGISMALKQFDELEDDTDA